MASNFHHIILQLFQRLSLVQSESDGNIVSLQIGGQEIHITEYPENNLVMFCHIEHAKIAGQPVLFQQNMFTDNILTPILSQEKSNQDWVLWNRQSFNNSNLESVYQQLELLSDSSDKILNDKITEKNNFSKNSRHTFNY